MDKRLIEVDFPLKEVSEESRREKSVRHGHIATLHLWWARRPLAASRATIFAALTPAPSSDGELRKKLEFISKLSKWKNPLDEHLTKEARREIRNFFDGKSPKVLDCFAGGGSIPLEALRLGCETYALELNPVAVLILKAVLEFPQKFGRRKVKISIGLSSSSNNKLLEDVKKWGKWVSEEARKDIGKFYPSDKDGSVPVGYLWARTIKCQNPSCNAEIPLMGQLWLARSESKKFALKMVVNKHEKTVRFIIAKGKDVNFDPSVGTAKRATVMCPVCQAGIDSKTVKDEAWKGRIGQKLIAVITHPPRQKGKSFRLANKKDVTAFDNASFTLSGKMEHWDNIPLPIPDEKLEQSSYIFVYGARTWGDLFNPRQQLALATFVEKVKLSFEKMLSEGYQHEYAKAIVTYLALAVDRLSSFNSTLSMWVSQGGFIANTFTRQALPMIWDYCEVNPFSETTGDWNSATNWILRVIQHCITISSPPAKVIQGTATRLPYPENFFDAVMTDPPYYDNVPYADLSDFFYVWLKRTLGDLYPDLLSTPLTPKGDEIVELAERNPKYAHKTKEFFESELTKSFSEICRVLKEDGVSVIVFAHKSTEAWETLINSLLKSGLTLVASWPVHTERGARLRAKESAALASSIYMVCRKRKKEPVAYFNQIKSEIEKRIKEKLNQFWEQGISGADFFVSAIGPAVEVFGKYSKVERLSGEEVSVQELLEYVRKIVSEFALERVLKRADLGGVDAETRFYLLWRWTFGNAKVHFDDAIKLSRPMGVELTNLWDRGGFVKKEKEYIRVLDPKGREKDAAFARKTKFTSMIDVLHHVVILWERGNKERIKEVLDETGYAGNEIFWQTAQAISEILPQGDKEKQLLQGFLYGKEVYIKEAARGKKTLLDFVED